VFRYATKVSTKPNYLLTLYPELTAITALFLKTYFFKLASDVSGEEQLRLEYMKANRNAYGERMTEAQEQQLERRLTKLCQMD
jgi:hypothetical protein